MSQQEYLSIFGAILFGLSASFYLFSWAHLIQSNKIIKEWKFVVWSFPFFMLTLLDWYMNWDIISQIDSTVWLYLAGFVSTGLYFVMSVIINPRKFNKIGWSYLDTRTDELLLVGTIIILWAFALEWIYQVEIMLPFVWTLPPFILLILWYWKKQAWISWVYLAYIYIIVILVLIELS